jgi:hypothetical protein
LLHVELFVAATSVLLPPPLLPRCHQAAPTTVGDYILIVIIVAVSVAIASAAFG